MKIIFAGTPDFAAKTLKGLLDKGIKISACYTQPDRPSGRGKKLSPSPVKILANEHKIPVYQPSTFKEDRNISELSALKPDLIIVVAYGLILPRAVLAIPTHGCINVHGSLLPKWRGAAPVQYAILNGDSQTGVTIFRLNEGVDTGDILTTRGCPLLDTDTTSSVLEKFVPMGIEALCEVIGNISTNSLKISKQDDKLATFAPKIHKDAGIIRWNEEDSTAICRKLRAFSSWPFTYYLGENGDKIKLLAAHCAKMTDSNYKNARPGTILEASKDSLLIKTIDGALAITKLQFPSSKPLSANDVRNSPKYLSILMPQNS